MFIHCEREVVGKVYALYTHLNVDNYERPLNIFSRSTLYPVMGEDLLVTYSNDVGY